MATLVTPARHRSIISSVYTRTDTNGEIVYANVDDESNLAVSDSRTTNSNVNWKQVIARGGDASSGYDLIRHRHRTLRGYGSTSGVAAFGPPKVTYRGELRSYGYLFDYTSYLADGDDADLKDQALTRLKRKLAKHNGNVNVLIPMAEIKELRSTIHKTAALATNLLNVLIDIRRTKGRSAWRFASEAWLNFSFGVSPLVNDAIAISESIEKYMNSKNHTVRLDGSSSKIWFGSPSKNRSIGAFGADLHTEARVVHTLSYKYTAGFDIRFEASNRYGIGSQFGLEFGAIIPTLWELVPYSWIVDYFSTVGAYLDDVFVSAAGSTRYVTLARKYSATVDFMGTLKPNTANDSVVSQYFVPGFYDYYHFTRTPLQTLPHAALRIKTVDEIGRNAVNKLLNLGSLFIVKQR